MVIAHGDVVWIDLGSPRGSKPAKRRPAVGMQENWLLASTIATVLVVPLISNVALEAVPGNVLLSVDVSGLDEDSDAVVSQIGPVSWEHTESHPDGRVPSYVLTKIAAGIQLVLGI